MSPEIVMWLIGGLLTVCAALIGALWFLLWQIIETLRKDVSELRETVVSLNATVCVLREWVMATQGPVNRQRTHP